MPTNKDEFVAMRPMPWEPTPYRVGTYDEIADVTGIGRFRIYRTNKVYALGLNGLAVRKGNATRESIQALKRYAEEWRRLGSRPEGEAS